MQEFDEYPIKQGQKAFLNIAYTKLGRYHYKGKVKTTAQKVTSLLMARLGGIKVEDMSMHLECESVFDLLFVLLCLMER